jgi:SAM-dependent methyltransferase
MEAPEYERIAAAQETHWWYRATRALMRDFLAPSLAPGLAILDIGCGPGGNGAWLAEFGSVVGIDVAPSALAFARSRWPDVTYIEASATDLPFPDGSFDIVVMVTVLYLLEDDGRAAAEAARVLRPGGVLLSVEPAFEVLGRGHDKVVHARRRYRRGELRRLFEAAGLRVGRSTCAHAYLAPPAFLLGLLQRIRPTSPETAISDIERGGPAAILARLATLERRVLKRRDLAVGLSAVTLARRPGG